MTAQVYALFTIGLNNPKPIAYVSSRKVLETFGLSIETVESIIDNGNDEAEALFVFVPVNKDRRPISSRKEDSLTISEYRALQPPPPQRNTPIDDDVFIRIINLLDAGCSIRKTANYTGVSKSSIHRLRKNHNQTSQVSNFRL